MKSNNLKKHVTVFNWFLGFALLILAAPCASLTLGQVRGAVLLGQPLSLTVTLQVGPDEILDGLCFDADVFYGENRQDTSRVSVNPILQQRGNLNSVQIVVSAPIDEPVVTLYVRSTCAAKTSKKFVLLSDLASDVLAQIPNLGDRTFSNSVAVQSTVKAAPFQRPPSNKASNSSAQERQRSVVREPKLTLLDERKGARTTLEMTKSGAGRSKLTMSVVDLIDIRDPRLKISGQLMSIPSDDLAKRAMASAIWLALNKSPEDQAKDLATLAELTGDVDNLRAITNKNQQDLADLATRLHEAESERYANPFVYLLAALLLATAAALVLFVIRRRTDSEVSGPWWRADRHQAVGVTNQTDPEDPEINVVYIPSSFVSTPDAQPIAHELAGALSKSEFRNSGLDIDLDLDSPINPALKLSEPVRRDEIANRSASIATLNIGQRDAVHSLHASLQALNTQEMLDVRQQADFFMTLGQHEEAIQVLEASLLESESSNPLVYLDLLAVLHTLSRKSSFDKHRADFNELFTGRVPIYSSFGRPGNSLDAYPQICGEIENIWGKDSTIEFLEQCMVRRSEDALDHYFDLEAFRDLLMLHAVASRFELSAETDSAPMPFSAVKTNPPVESLDSLQGDRFQASATGEDNPHNLIDFDVSGLSATAPLADK